LAGIEQKSIEEPDETTDWDEQGSPVRAAVGFSGYGIGTGCPAAVGTAESA